MYVQSNPSPLLQEQIPLTRHGEIEAQIELINKSIKVKISLKDTVEQLKEKIREAEHLAEDEYISLLLNGETLEDDRTLESYNIDHTTPLHQYVEEHEEATKLTNKCSFAVGISFNRVNEENKVQLPVVPKGHDYHKVIDGLNLKGTCLNTECKAKNQVIWIQKGMGTFDICEEVYTSICPSCKEVAKNIDNLGFINCLYSVKGFQVTPENKKIEIDDIVADEKGFSTFESTDGLAHWATLKITTKPRNYAAINVNSSIQPETVPKKQPNSKCSIQ